MLGALAFWLSGAVATLTGPAPHLAGAAWIEQIGLTPRLASPVALLCPAALLALPWLARSAVRLRVSPLEFGVVTAGFALATGAACRHHSLFAFTLYVGGVMAWTAAVEIRLAFRVRGPRSSLV